MLRKTSCTTSVLVIVLLAASLVAGAAEWKMKQAHIMTPWSELIDPENVLPEYPRPQLVRPDWVNLNGIWDFTRTPNRVYSPNQQFTDKILVPFPVESAISGLMWTDLDNLYID